MEEKKQKGAMQRGQKKEKVKPQTKIVIRHLPPTMSEEEFLKQVDPLPDHDFYYYVNADWSLGYDATCCAYISLRKYDDVFLFRDRFDGYVFVDKYGAEYSAIVEFAPFQGIAKNKSRCTDSKVNTIEEEPHYQQFLKKLEEDREAAAKGYDAKLEFTLERKKEKITSTPLLQYVEKKIKRAEAKKRSKEKRRQAQQQQQKVTKIISNEDAGAGAGIGCGDAGGGAAGGGGANKWDDKPLGSSAKNETGEEKKTSETEQSDASKANPKQSETQQQQQQQKNTDDSKEPIDSKKTSKKRDRNRNRKNKEKSPPKKVTSSTSGLVADKSVLDLNKPTNLMRAAATTINSDPQAKHADEQFSGQLLDSNVIKGAMPKTIDHTEATTVEAPASDVKQTESGRLQNGKKSADARGKKPISYEERQKKKQRAADEQRRIRNKDRLSIAICQPKPPQRQSKERVVAVERKDADSNTTSDLKSLKKEDNHNEKLSRYSERRSLQREPVKVGP